MATKDEEAAPELRTQEPGWDESNLMKKDPSKGKAGTSGVRKNLQEGSSVNFALTSTRGEHGSNCGYLIFAQATRVPNAGPVHSYRHGGWEENLLRGLAWRIKEKLFRMSARSDWRGCGLVSEENLGKFTESESVR